MFPLDQLSSMIFPFWPGLTDVFVWPTLPFDVSIWPALSVDVSIQPAPTGDVYVQPALTGDASFWPALTGDVSVCHWFLHLTTPHSCFCLVVGLISQFKIFDIWVLYISCLLTENMYNPTNNRYNVLLCRCCTSIMLCDAISVILCGILWCVVILCDTFGYCVMPCDTMWCLLIPCNALWCCNAFQQYSWTQTFASCPNCTSA